MLIESFYWHAHLFERHLTSLPLFIISHTAYWLTHELAKATFYFSKASTIFIESSSTSHDWFNEEMSTPCMTSNDINARARYQLYRRTAASLTTLIIADKWNAKRLTLKTLTATRALWNATCHRWASKWRRYRYRPPEAWIRRVIAASIIETMGRKPFVINKLKSQYFHRASVNASARSPWCVERRNQSWNIWSHRMLMRFSMMAW